jgi:hypothetical protein
MKLHIHKWKYSGPYKNFRRCLCGESQYRIWNIYGILSKWFTLRGEVK